MSKFPNPSVNVVQRIEPRTRTGQPRDYAIVCVSLQECSFLVMKLIASETREDQLAMLRYASPRVRDRRKSF